MKNQNTKKTNNTKAKSKPKSGDKFNQPIYGTVMTEAEARKYMARGKK